MAFQIDLKGWRLFERDGVGGFALLLADHFGINLSRSDATVSKHLWHDIYINANEIRIVANEWRRQWNDNFFVIPADFTQFLKACWAIERLKPLKTRPSPRSPHMCSASSLIGSVASVSVFLSAESDAVTSIGTTLDILPFELKKVAET